MRRATCSFPRPPPAAAYFYPRSPCGERLKLLSLVPCLGHISIHALLAESDGGTPGLFCNQLQFLSTLSLRRATYNINPNISIHALLAESDIFQGMSFNALLIFLSTLSLRRATRSCADSYVGFNISIHALLAESDHEASMARMERQAFLSTLSLRRATHAGVRSGGRHRDFYPRSPCGERLEHPPNPAERTPISIHALLAESDLSVPGTPTRVVLFLSTLSLRRATSTRGSASGPNIFLSTLSLRRATPGPGRPAPARRNFYPRSPCGERQHAKRLLQPRRNFYPRSPCGERLDAADSVDLTAAFLSTLSLRRATHRRGSGC